MWPQHLGEQLSLVEETRLMGINAHQAMTGTPLRQQITQCQRHR